MIHPELTEQLAAELAETEKALGPLPEGISLKTITRDCDNLHIAALICILQGCRDLKNYDMLVGFSERRKVETRREEEITAPEIEEAKWILRMYDGMDGLWLDIGNPCSREEADRAWNKYTKNGREKTSYADIDYYKVFPANTRMLRS